MAGTEFVAFREIRGDAGRWFEDDEKTVVDGHTRHALHGDCAIEDSTSEDSPTDYSGPVGKCEINAPSEKGELDAVIRATVGDGCAVENSPSDEAPSNASVLNWADEINDSCQDDCKIPVDSRKGQEDSAISDSSVEETLTDVSVSTPVATSPRI